MYLMCLFIRYNSCLLGKVRYCIVIKRIAFVINDCMGTPIEFRVFQYLKFSLVLRVIKIAEAQIILKSTKPSEIIIK